jgi:hypothetical protein
VSRGAELPRPVEGTTRAYRGTGHPDAPQVAERYRGDPASAPSGANDFLTAEEAKLHSGAGHPEGVSVSESEVGATNYPGDTVVYDVPNDVFDKLPKGDPALQERVFKHSVPEVYRVGVIRRRGR